MESEFFDIGGYNVTLDEDYQVIESNEYPQDPMNVNLMEYCRDQTIFWAYNSVPFIVEANTWPTKECIENETKMNHYFYNLCINSQQCYIWYYFAYWPVNALVLEYTPATVYTQQLLHRIIFSFVKVAFEFTNTTCLSVLDLSKCTSICINSDTLENYLNTISIQKTENFRQFAILVNVFIPTVVYSQFLNQVLKRMISRYDLRRGDTVVAIYPASLRLTVLIDDSPVFLDQEVMELLKNLTKLEVKLCFCKPDSMNFGFDLIKRLNRLTTLNGTDLVMTGEVQHMLDSCRNKLYGLELENSSLTQEDVGAILESNVTGRLELLDLSNNDLDKCIKLLSRVVQKVRGTLKTLLLRHCRIKGNNPGWYDLLLAIHRCKKLEEMDLHGNELPPSSTLDETSSTEEYCPIINSYLYENEATAPVFPTEYYSSY